MAALLCAGCLSAFAEGNEHTLQASAIPENTVAEFALDGDGKAEKSAGRMLKLKSILSSA